MFSSNLLLNIALCWIGFAERKKSIYILVQIDKIDNHILQIDNKYKILYGKIVNFRKIL